MAETTFEKLAAGAEIDVALGAALIARDAYPTLDVHALVQRFDDLAGPLVSAGLEAMTAAHAAEAIGAHVYDALGFAGNEADYYDPRNSFLNDVLERRLGIPISLALVYCEIARRAGVRAEGVGFPGHFLVRVFGRAADEVLVDPFYRGRVVDGAGLAEIFERVADQASVEKKYESRADAARALAEMTVAATPRSFLTRWLMNLRSIHLARGDLSRALLVVDRIASLNPRDRGVLRDRGLLEMRLGAKAAARDDLALALSLDPSGEHADEIRALLAQLDERPTASN